MRDQFTNYRQWYRDRLAGSHKCGCEDCKKWELCVKHVISIEDGAAKFSPLMLHGLGKDQHNFLIEAVCLLVARSS